MKSQLQTVFIQVQVMAYVLLRVSLIAGMEYGMEQWNGKWNGTAETSYGIMHRSHAYYCQGRLLLRL